MTFRFVAIAVLSLTLSACSTSKGGLRYATPATSTTTTAAGNAAIGRFADERGEPANWLGAIRGGFGNPLKRIETEQPVADVVQSAFADALRSRGLLATEGARTRIEGTIRRLDGDKFARSESNAEIVVRVVDVGAGTTTFERTYVTATIEGSALTLKTGIFASVDELRDLIARTLSQTIDKALDDPELRAALGS
jgi:uncharacterized lipoprotein YajG